jgi:ATP-dependent protease Clp ATPase subunit
MRDPVYCHFCKMPRGECLARGVYLVQQGETLICEHCVQRCAGIIAEAKLDAREYAARETGTAR